MPAPVDPAVREQALASLKAAISNAERQAIEEKALTEDEFTRRKRPILAAYQQAQADYRAAMRPVAEWREAEYQKSGDRVRAAVAGTRAAYKLTTGENAPEGL